jgi:hypothetical protein
MPSISLSVDSSAAIQGMRDLGRSAEEMGSKVDTAVNQIDKTSSATKESGRQFDIYGASIGSAQSSINDFSEASSRSSQSAQTLGIKMQTVSAAMAGIAALRSISKDISENGINMQTMGNAAALAAHSVLSLNMTLQQLKSAREAQAAITGVSVAVGGLGAAVKASPLAALSIALSVLSVGMSLFTSKTKEAEGAIKALAEASKGLEERKSLIDYRKSIGANVNPLDESKLQLAMLESIASKGASGNISPDALARGTGMTTQQIQEMIGSGNVRRKDAPLTGYEGIGGFKRPYEPSYTGEYSGDQVAQLLQKLGIALKTEIDRLQLSEGKMYGPPAPAGIGNYDQPYTGNASPDLGAGATYVESLRETYRLQGLSKDIQEQEIAVKNAKGVLTKEEEATVRSMVAQQQQLQSAEKQNAESAKKYMAEKIEDMDKQLQLQNQMDANVANNATQQAEYIAGLRDQLDVERMSTEKAAEHLAIKQAESIARSNGQTLTTLERDSIIETTGLLERQQQIRQIGAQVDAQLASSFVGLITGAQTAKQALAGLLQMLMQIAAQQAFRGLTGSLLGNFNSPGGSPATGATSMSALNAI